MLAFQIIRPRPLRPEWGEAVTAHHVLASGDYTDEELRDLAQERMREIGK